MKRLYSLLFISCSWFALSAQAPGNGIVPLKMKDAACFHDDYRSNSTPSQTFADLMANRPAFIGSTRAVNVVQLGTAGNLFTILDGQVNRVAANQTLNTVAFIHRVDNTIAPFLTNNIGQYTYDLSTDGGNTWDLNNGILNPTGDNTDFAGRYPNATIYNPVGNTQVQNAYLAYVGAWLPFSNGNADWDGVFTGVARLNNDTATFTENILAPNNSDVAVVKGLCNGLPGIFWAVDFANNGTDNLSILLYRGVWSSTNNDIAWSLYQNFLPPFDLDFDGGSQVTSINMAFDPSGRYGWIVALGDIVAGGPRVFHPFYYRTTDGGFTWSGPIDVDLQQFDLVVNNLIDPLTDSATTAFDADIAVDINGNPHTAVVIGTTGNDYAISSGTGAKMRIYDITYDGNACGGWNAILLDSIQTFRGDITADVTEDNRPQISTSPDGSKVVFGWADSDPAFTGGDNILPNLKTRAIDVATGLATPVVNHTEGDPVWEGAALFASFAPTSFVQGGNITVPTVFGQLNQLTLSDADPASFFYIQNVQHALSSFTSDIQAPTITLNGGATLTIVNGTTFTDPGYTANDNVDGNVSANVTVSGTVNTAANGTYTLTYSVSDAAGNAACSVQRIVRVVASADVVNPVVTLVGDDTLNVDVCNFFVDPGATANDNVSGDVTATIVTSGTVPSGTPGNPGTAGTYTITYTATDGAGNTGTATRTVILSDAAPVIQVIGGTADTIEACDTYVEQGAIAYDFCTGPITTSVAGSVNNTTPGNYTITYTATDGSNTATATRIVTVTPDGTPPTLSFNGSNTSYVYLGDTYNDTLPDANDCSGIASLTSNAATTVNSNSRGNYVVTYTATDNSGNTATITRNVIVNTEPDTKFGAVPTVATTVAFSDSSLYNPTAWLWEFGDGTSNTTRNPTKTFTSVGDYNVCLTATNVFNAAPFNKPAKKVCDTVRVTSINDIELAANFTIFPNPTTGLVNIEVSNFSFEQMDVTVYNVLGEAVKAVNFNNVAPQSKYMVDLTSLVSGMYVVKIGTAEGTVTKKVNIYSGN
ncbi:MAG: DUF5011 domain-containing protein [Chitinophagales bacterium]|nr:DUF5011 domain-containing protein [Chitinophagales bacterium]